MDTHHRAGITDPDVDDPRSCIRVPVPETTQEHTSEFLGMSLALRGVQHHSWDVCEMKPSEGGPDPLFHHQFDVKGQDQDFMEVDDVHVRVCEESTGFKSVTMKQSCESRLLSHACSDMKTDLCDDVSNMDDIMNDAFSHIEINLHGDRKGSVVRLNEQYGQIDGGRSADCQPSNLGVQLRDSVRNAWGTHHNSGQDRDIAGVSHEIVQVETSEHAQTDSQTYARDIHWSKLEGESYFLGRGSFGRCYMAMDMVDNSFIAVKEQILSEKCTPEAVASEIDVLTSLHHPNILQYYRDTQEKDLVYIFTRWMRGGSLDNLLNQLVNLPLQQTLWQTKQILQGLDYLHNNNILHRDIKPANILLDESHQEVVLADFGLSVRLDSGLSSMKGTAMEGTLAYMAPESVRSFHYGRSSDIWSVGCTVFEMVTKQSLWQVTEPPQLVFKIGMARDPPGKLYSARHLGISDELLRLITWCLKVEHLERPSARELLDLLEEHERKIVPMELGNAELPQEYCGQISLGEKDIIFKETKYDASLPSNQLQMAVIDDPEDIL